MASTNFPPNFPVRTYTSEPGWPTPGGAFIDDDPRLITAQMVGDPAVTPPLVEPASPSSAGELMVTAILAGGFGVVLAMAVLTWSETRQPLAVVLWPAVTLAALVVGAGIGWVAARAVAKLTLSAEGRT